MARRLPQITVSAASSRIVKINGKPQLDDSELITGVSISDADGLTITNEQLNASAMVVFGESVAASKGMFFLLVNPTAQDDAYEVVISITTDSSPSQTQTWELPIKVV